VKSNTVYCETCGTYIHAHELLLIGKRTIHEVMPGMTCHEICKSEVGHPQIWRRDSKGNHNISINHPVIGQIREKLGLSKTKRKKEKTNAPKETEEENTMRRQIQKKDRKVKM
jgi:hypothetical protein